MGVIDAHVVNYQVLDLMQTKGLGMYYVFAIQQINALDRRLLILQIVQKSPINPPSDPSMQEYDLDKLQCGEVMEVSESILVLACQSTKTISIYRRKTMAEIYKRTFTLNRFYGEEMKIISHLDGKQNYVFYTIRSNKVNAIGMFEVLINEKLNDND